MLYLTNINFKMLLKVFKPLNALVFTGDSFGAYFLEALCSHQEYRSIFNAVHVMQNKLVHPILFREIRGKHGLASKTITYTTTAAINSLLKRSLQYEPYDIAFNVSSGHEIPISIRKSFPMGMWKLHPARLSYPYECPIHSLLYDSCLEHAGATVIKMQDTGEFSGKSLFESPLNNKLVVDYEGYSKAASTMLADAICSILAQPLKEGSDTYCEPKIGGHVIPTSVSMHQPYSQIEKYFNAYNGSDKYIYATTVAPNECTIYLENIRKFTIDTMPPYLRDLPVGIVVLSKRLCANPLIKCSTDYIELVKHKYVETGSQSFAKKFSMHSSYDKYSSSVKYICK
jgi:hypothetical protein